MSQKLHYALFKAAPNTQPPFALELGIDANNRVEISGCEHIPDAVQKMEEYVKEKGISYAENFTLVYPIFMQAMNTEHESTMHSIAWLIKDEADKKSWNFDRIGGYTGKTEDSFW
jgi:hypothetical protein